MNSLRKWSASLWDGALTFQRSVVILLSLYSVILIVLQVIFRYFLELSIMWVEELTLYMVFWFYLFGASLCTYDRTHIKGGIVHVLFRKYPRILNSFDIGIAFASLALSVLFTIWGYQAFVFGLEIHRKTVQLTLPYAYAQLSLVPGFGLMAIYFLYEAIDRIRLGSRPTEEGGPHCLNQG